MLTAHLTGGITIVCSVNPQDQNLNLVTVKISVTVVLYNICEGFIKMRTSAYLVSRWELH
jgi:hypothetical protein